MSIYPSKVDWWLATALVVVPLLLSGVGVLVFIRHKPLGIIVIGVGAVIATTMALLSVPCRYTISDSSLEIRCGLMHETIPLSNIVAAVPSSSLQSAPALSLQRVKITLGSGGSRLISPLDRDKFIKELEDRIKKA